MAQELAGFYVFIKQLKKLGVIGKKDISFNTAIYQQVIDVYNKMGDLISL
jgi:hypothetical protein